MEDRPGAPHQQDLSVRVTLRPLRTDQNCLCPTPTFVYSKTAPCSAPFGHSETSAARSVYGSPHGH